MATRDEAPRPTLLARLGSAGIALLLSLLGASLSALPELLACAAVSGLVLRRQRGEAIAHFDAGCLVAALLLVAWLARRIVRPGFVHVDVRGVSESVPSTSAFHAAFDLAFLGLGLVLVGAFYSGPAPQDGGATDLGMGIGFVAVPALLFTLRLVFWRRRPREDG